MLDVVCYIAALCVASDYAPASEVSGFVRAMHQGRPVVASPEAVERLGARLDFMGGDNFVTLRAGSLRQTCVDGACVVFRTSCANLVCTWQAGAARPANGKPFLAEVRVAATSSEAMARARSAVFVSLEVGGQVRRVSLAQLGEGGPADPGRYTAPMWPADGRPAR
ncbi:hypothetical protein [Caulobacter endophyticus]|uniref:hypothetical protein n=1 Tax=Caulobacter endophyticus TaxID=2172652 RepID=UPI00240FB125|nr:hypothetical protein [Caulobacter endophyticus]MDG2530320.1 hypothetical protein [Caulobacter endophyticus]